MRVRGDDGVLAVAVVVQVLVLTCLPRVVTVDGPAHVDGAWVLLHAGDPVVHAFYRVDLAPVPNLLATYLLAGLLALTGPDMAERLLVAGYAVLLTLGLRYALRGVHPRAGWLAVAAVPFLGGYLYSYGFYDFLLGLALSLFVVGLALRRAAGWTLGSGLGLAGLLLLTWSAHLLPVLVAGLFVAVLAVVRTAFAAGGAGSRRAAATRHLLPPVLAGLPVLALTAGFVVRSAGQRGAAVHLPFGQLVLGLVTLGRPLVDYTVWEYVPAVAVAVVLVLLALRGRPPCPSAVVVGGPPTPEGLPTSHDLRDAGQREAHGRAASRTALGITAALTTLWYLASPDRYGPAYGFLNDRLSLFPPLLLVLCAAGPPPRPAVRRGVTAGLLVAAVGLVGLRLPTDLRYQRDVAEYLSVADAVPRGATLVSLRLWRDPPVGPEARNPYRDPLRHLSGRLAVAAHGVDVGHYEAVTGYFPVQFRAATNPRLLLDPTLDGLDEVPPVVDLARAVPVVDVVLVVGRNRASPAVLASPAVRSTQEVLDARYRLVDVSDRSGLVEVWQRRDLVRGSQSGQSPAPDAQS